MSLIRKYKYWILVVIVAGIVWAVKWNDDRVASERAVGMLECIASAQDTFLNNFKKECIKISIAKNKKTCSNVLFNGAEIDAKSDSGSIYKPIWDKYQADISSCK